MKTVFCPKCKLKMILIGVTDRQMWKFYCTKCYMILEKERKKKDGMG